MQITFDPHNPEECATIARLLGTTAQPDTAQPDTATAQPDTAPAAQPDTAPAAQPETAPTQPDTAQPETAPTQPETGETDCHGMTHDDTIHSTPASKNADGSWRAKRGQKEAYEAAIAAATGKDAPAPAPQGMPVPQPASAVDGVVMDHAVTVCLGLCRLGLGGRRVGLCRRGRVGLCRCRVGILISVIINQPHFYDVWLGLGNNAQSFVALVRVTGVKGDLHGSSPVWVAIF